MNVGVTDKKEYVDCRTKYLTRTGTVFSSNRKKKNIDKIIFTQISNMPSYYF